ncbi:hypothetical protein [Streptomyces sp. NBC_00827]|uniref:hypothetical protein n=1 Tax=Streptomyces sp. NBC_00827 TaxID=2903677 RepID=UPI0038675545|nr:hypothetical protein OG569_00135 [Streptomyces sp. NBC_00827]
MNAGIPRRRPRKRAACSAPTYVPVAAEGTTTVYVAHDQVEVLMMGEWVAVMKVGVLQQVGMPKDVHSKSANVNVFVGEFIGSAAMNQFTVPLTDQGVCFGDAVVGLSCEMRDAFGQQARETVLGVRPEPGSAGGR